MQGRGWRQAGGGSNSLPSLLMVLLLQLVWANLLLKSQCIGLPHMPPPAPSLAVRNVCGLKALRACLAHDEGQISDAGRAGVAVDGGDTP